MTASDVASLAVLGLMMLATLSFWFAHRYRLWREDRDVRRAEVDRENDPLL